MNRYSLFSIGIFSSLFIFFTFLVLHDPFFWDTVQLASSHASFYYYSHFSSLLLPDAIDSGHPPLLGLYLACIWKCFGRTLWVSHLSMLPFLLGTVYQTFRLSNYFFAKKWLFLVMSFILLDATVLAQATLVSPDNLLVFFFLLSLNSIFRQEKGFLFFGVLGLSVVSMRGMSLNAALFTFYFILYHKKYTTLTSIGKDSWPWVAGGSVGIAFLGYHFIQKGWIGYHADSPWSGSFQLVDFNGFLKNCVVLAWRILDFGRISIWICIAWGGWLGFKARSLKNEKTQQLFLLLFLILGFSSFTFLLYTGLNAHRYLIPVYLCASLLAAHLTVDILFVKIQSKIWVVAFFLTLLSGNFWVYPDRISKGWDATLAYLPYFDLRQKMKHYIQEEKIPIQDISSAFPNEVSFDLIELSGDTTHFSHKMLESRFVFYSNIYNDYSEDQLAELDLRWKKRKEFCKGQVRVTLYEK